MSTRLLVLTLILIFFSAATATAQWSYWVIESNVNTKGFTIVKVYGPTNELVAQREVHRTFDITRARDRRKLDRIMTTALIAQAGTVPRRTKRLSKDLNAKNN